MSHWKLTLAYDGTPFYGWQVQPNLPTIQGTLADAILRLTGEEVLPQGSGRTDAGVHALAQVASFSLKAPIPAANLQVALNRTLPASIRVLRTEEVPTTFHARHSAKLKTYEYRIFLRKRGTGPDHVCPPTLAPYVWDCSWRVNFDAMKQAAQHVVGEHDFSSFAAHDPDQSSRRANETTPSNMRTILSSEWREEDGLLTYRVIGTGFLHHMVRNLAGTFVYLGSGRMASDDIPGILAAKDRRRAGPTAPASGLFLLEVGY